MKYSFNLEKKSITITKKTTELSMFKDEEDELHLKIRCKDQNVSALLIASMLIDKDFELYPFFKKLIDDIKVGKIYKVTENDIDLAHNKESLERARSLRDSFNNSEEINPIESGLLYENKIILGSDDPTNLEEKIIIEERKGGILLLFPQLHDNSKSYKTRAVKIGLHSRHDPFNKCFYRMYDEIVNYIMNSDSYKNDEKTKKLIME